GGRASPPADGEGSRHRRAERAVRRRDRGPPHRVALERRAPPPRRGRPRGGRPPVAREHAPSPPEQVDAGRAAGLVLELVADGTGPRQGSPPLRAGELVPATL